MLTIHEGVLKLIRTIEDSTLDAQKFDEGVHVAGRRVRKTLAEGVVQIKELKAAILVIQKKRKG